MAKKNDKQSIWNGIHEFDFAHERDIEDVDVAEYDKANMVLYGANTNLWRMLIRLSDSLKPVERRLLWSLYKGKAFPGTKTKSSVVVGNTMIFHGHGDTSLYNSLVGMVQPWKKQCPLVHGKGNFGSNTRPDLYAHQRYTGVSLTKYAKECFFDDYDDECIETVFNSASDMQEPMSLPAKFPNVLVNGGLGIAFGNAFRIPTYNVHDIIDICKKVILDPQRASVFMIPDLPSGCDIVDDGNSFQEMINNGKSVLKMRASTEILEGNKTWVIKITSLPWMTSLSTIHDRIISLVEAGSLPIKDTQDHSAPYRDSEGNLQSTVDYRLVIDKAHDPRTILEKLYSTTDLQKSVSIDFKVVLDNLTVKRLNMRDLIISWIDERRAYKRRLFNKQLTRISARIDLLRIMIHLTEANNLEKTTKIIKNSNEEIIVKQLMKLCDMSSYQATKIADMKLKAFSKDARKRNIEAKAKLEKELAELMKLIGSEDKIDQIIISELEDLRKYGTPRRCKIVAESGQKHIADTVHNIVISKNGLLKKLPYYKDNDAKNVAFGAFKAGDIPIHHTMIHNTKQLLLIDSFGQYSIIPTHEIDTCEPSSYGVKIFDLAKLSGRIIACMEAPDQEFIDRVNKLYGEPSLLLMTERGFGKRMHLGETLVSNAKNPKNISIMKIRDDDALVCAKVVLGNAGIIIYSERGRYNATKLGNIAEQAKSSMGLLSITLESMDKVVDAAIAGSDDPYVVVLTSKGMGKKVDMRYFSISSKRNISKDQGSLITLDASDTVRYVGSITQRESLKVVMRNNLTTISFDDIPDQLKKTKGKRLVVASNVTNIVAVTIE